MREWQFGPSTDLLVNEEMGDWKGLPESAWIGPLSSSLSSLGHSASFFHVVFLLAYYIFLEKVKPFASCTRKKGTMF